MTDVNDFDENDPSLGDWARDFGKDSDSQQLAAGPDGTSSGGAMAHVMINNNGLPGIGLHASVMVDQPGKDPVLYDPRGHYRADVPPHEGGRPRGSDALSSGLDYDDYLKYHRQSGPNVDVYRFPLSNDEADQIRSRINAKGLSESLTGLDCADYTSQVLQGIGPFKTLETSLTPSGLGRDMRRLKGLNSGWF